MTGRTRAVFLFLALFVIATVGAELLLRRGFRANSTPPAWEVAVARSLRNFAIPGDEGKKKNPVAATPGDLRQGRDLFLSRCANCHGVDGSGRTPIGSSEYPRVPDLRSSSTQNLSDGEIHYIIENGVQLTGMPALSSADSSSDSWQLVLFVRSLRPLSQGERAQVAATASSARYSGSQSCKKCHQEIYARWKKTPMANVVRDPREHPEAITPDLATNRMEHLSKDQVAFVYGSLWKQNYFTKVGDDHFPLPVQWDFADRSWRPYHVPEKGGDWWTAFYPPDNMQRRSGPRGGRDCNDGAPRPT